MSNLVYHPNTEESLDSLVDNPKQAVLIVGEKGSGKHTAAISLASRAIGAKQAKIAEHPYVKLIPEDIKTISIDSIRELQNFIKLKVPGKTNQINRVIVIENAGNMGHEAQNALLKMLEEPPEKTMFILTASSEQDLLETIKSRVTIVPLLPISKSLAIEYFSNLKFKEPDIAKDYIISGGRVGLLSSLLSEVNHPLVTDIQLAKDILAEPRSKRLLRVDGLSKDKNQINGLLDALLSIAHAALTQASLTGKDDAVKTWHKRQEAALQSRVLLSSNANTKLLLDNLFLSM